jgi:transcriptional regulator with XRE-family HTH domain
MSKGEDPGAASAAFGERLRAIREAQGLSLEQLGARTGVHWTAIGRLERGKREPRLTTVLRLAEGLGVDPGELVDGLDV